MVQILLMKVTYVYTVAYFGAICWCIHLESVQGYVMNVQQKLYMFRALAVKQHSIR